MSENKNIIARSIRADEAVFEKFRELAENFDSQGDLLARLISDYEFLNAKEKMPGTAASIDDFKQLLSKLEHNYLHMLDMSYSAEERACDAAKDAIAAKERTIANLHNQIDELKEAVKTAEERTKESIKALYESERELKNLKATHQTLQETLKDKQTIISTLESEKEKHEALAAEYQSLEKRYNDQVEMSTRITEQNKDLSARLIQTDAAVLQIKAEHDAALKRIELDCANTIKAAENEKFHAIFEAKEEAHKTIESYVEKYEAKIAEAESLRGELQYYKIAYEKAMGGAEMEKKENAET